MYREFLQLILINYSVSTINVELHNIKQITKQDTDTNDGQVTNRS